jgi:hypothetical protein
MQGFQLPSCPKCGNASPEKASERRADLSGSFFAPPAYRPKETIFTFRCKCGTTFTQKATAGEAEQLVVTQQSALESMTPRELDGEYTRLLSEPPPVTLPRDNLIERVLARLRRDLALVKHSDSP